MSDERVVKLEFYEDSAPYEGPRSPASPEELSEVIRRIHEGNLNASLWVYIGGDPEKVGYPVIPWLAVSMSRGMIYVSTEPAHDNFYDLVGDASATGTVPLVIGGQEAPFPRRFLVGVERAEDATLEFFRTATVDIEGGGWERQPWDKSYWR